MGSSKWVLGCVAILVFESIAMAQQATGSKDKPKMTQDQYKNIQVLKDIPADQLVPTMQFVAASLGIECDFCHVQGGFDKDDKKNKQTARKMMQMVFAINKENFEGRREVTCYSCHRGGERPMSIPAILAQETKPAEESDVPLPAVDATLEKYLAAVGGAAAIQKVTSRFEKGTATVGDHNIPVEIFAKAPDKRMSVMHSPNGDSITAYDGKVGWLGNPGRAARDMNASEMAGAQIDAQFYFSTQVKSLFTDLKAAPGEKIGDREMTVIRAGREAQPPVKLYFDPQSGLMVRLVRYTDTALGLMPTEIDYADFRENGGVKIPYRWTIARPNGRFTIQVNEVQQNIPLEDTKFEKPAEPPAK